MEVAAGLARKICRRALQLLLPLVQHPGQYRHHGKGAADDGEHFRDEVIPWQPTRNAWTFMCFQTVMLAIFYPPLK